MNQTISVYGQEIELTEPDGGYVTDVIILARVIKHGDDGKMYDQLMVSATETTTGMIFDGMVQALDGEMVENE